MTSDNNFALTSKPDNEFLQNLGIGAFYFIAIGGTLFLVTRLIYFGIKRNTSQNTTNETELV